MIINPTLPNDGETIDAADVNVPFNAILSVINGGIDSTNLADNSVTTAKIINGAVTEAKLADSLKLGWYSGLANPSSITHLGDRLYNIVFNGQDYTQELTEGTKLKFTRAAVAPTQSANLNGSTQFFDMASPNKMTFNDNFTMMIWDNLTSYPSTSNDGYMLGRSDGTAANAWGMSIKADGRVQVYVANGGTGNTRITTSDQAVPIGQPFHVAASWASGVVKIYINGKEVVTKQTTAGTAPTTVPQSGNFAVGKLGSYASSIHSQGKISQAAVFNAVLSAATIASYVGQTLTGSETNVLSAYSFAGNANDLNTTTPNNLTNNGTTTYVSESPFAGGSTSYETAGTTEYGVITTKPSYSAGNTTIQVCVPVGWVLPTLSMPSAVFYSSEDAPYGYPVNGEFVYYKWKDWTPQYTNLTIGSGAVFAKYIQIGKTIHFKFSFVYGSGSAVGSDPTFTLPVPCHQDERTVDGYNFIGVGNLLDTGISNGNAIIGLTSDGKVHFSALAASGTYVTPAPVTATLPFTWGAGDRMFVHGTYEAA